MAFGASIAVGLGVLGFLILIWGWRRRVGTAMHCRRCRFDLSGHAVGLGTCPECGADLGRPRAARRGKPRRSRVAVTVGLVLVVAAGGLTALRFRSLRWIEVAPAWWLVRIELPSVANARSAEILRELVARVDRGGLDRALLDELALRGLELQLDDPVNWQTEWGDLIVRAWIDGRLTDAQKAAFVRGAYAISVDGLPGPVAGAARIRIRFDRLRGAGQNPPSGAPNIAIQTAGMTLEPMDGGHTIELAGGTTFSSTLPAGAGGTGLTMRLPEQPPGRHPFTAHFEVSVAEGPIGAESPLGSWEESHAIIAHVPTAEEIPDNSELIEQLRALLDAKSLRQSLDEDGALEVTLTFELDRSRAGVSFSEARLDGRSARRHGIRTDRGMEHHKFSWTLDAAEPLTGAQKLTLQISSIELGGERHEFLEETLAFELEIEEDAGQ